MNEPSSLDRDAPRDAVTGLPAIDTVRGRIEDWLTQAAARGEAARVHTLLLGLRRFDAVNLAYGASAGDAALAEVGGRICRFAENELDGPWLVARGSGGNFLLAANEACSRERWQLFAEQLADLVSQSIPAAAGALRLSPRLALLRALADDTVESLLDRLGHTLGSRRLQGGRIAWADGESVLPGRTAAQLEADLLVAIDRDEIEILFQPQFDADDLLTGAEALARWRHPLLGRIGAAALFGVAERSDHVAPLSRHIARRALAAAKDWPPGLRLSLNVTPADLAAISYADTLLGIVHESGFPPDRLTLEVTEQVLLSDIHAAAKTLGRISAEGIRVALDDFGAGFCNFRYLKLLPLDYLKLDRSMVDGIEDDPRDLAVLRAIVAMARALSLKVIAEGIEDEAQRDLIVREGCDFYQGFLRAAPMSLDEFCQLAG
ncbi:GGDEF domain-containing phosphodiesterase [Novosphingobium sp. PS1R-30]|uniref:GGDEF domain-containing phosphodiesterase n=1 Tax=Novosphingobium anseongense TaxID=3133436 RepID=A0ABU8RSU8_9SPHN|nr:MAG: GGDEF domain-containing protein [Novosphingobium sp.]